MPRDLTRGALKGMGAGGGALLGGQLAGQLTDNPWAQVLGMLGGGGLGYLGARHLFNPVTGDKPRQGRVISRLRSPIKPRRDEEDE